MAVAAEKVKSAQALQEAYAAEENAERQRAERERATQTANIVVPAQIEKQRIETIAEADAEKIRRIKKGEADGVRFMMEAEGAGIRAILLQKAEGIQALVDAAGGDPQLASLLMITEQMPKLVAEQVKAISNLKIDNITVWEGGRKDGTGKTSTADFISGMVASLPPLHDIAKNAGIDLPQYLGKVNDRHHVKPETATDVNPEPKAPAAPAPVPAPIPAQEPAPVPAPAAPMPPPPPAVKQKNRPVPQSISFYCANCNQPLSADADAAGQMARCPKCSSSVRIPNRN